MELILKKIDKIREREKYGDNKKFKEGFICACDEIEKSIKGIKNRINKLNKGCGKYIRSTEFYTKDGIEINDYCGSLEYPKGKRIILCEECLYKKGKKK